MTEPVQPVPPENPPSIATDDGILFFIASHYYFLSILPLFIFVVFFLYKRFSLHNYFVEDMVVTPWDVSSSGGIDYNKLIAKFGSSAIDQSLIDR